MSARNTRDIAVFLGILTAGIVAFWLLRPSSPPSILSTELVVPAEEPLHPELPLFDLSSDASLIVYRAAPAEGGLLRTRRWGETTGASIEHTERAGLPAISPDGSEVAFIVANTDRVDLGAPGRLDVVTLGSGAVRTLTTDVVRGGVRWNVDGSQIYFTNPRLGLSRIGAEGGELEEVTRADSVGGREIHWGVEVIVDEVIAYTSSLVGEGDHRIIVHDLESGASRDLWPGSLPRYSQTGHLVFREGSDGALLAAPFAADGLDLTRTPVPVVAEPYSARGWPLFVVSRSGSLMYGARMGSPAVSPEWVDRTGATREVVPGWTVPGHVTYSSLALSPDGGRLAISIPDPDGAWHLWVRDLVGAGQPIQRLTDEGFLNYRPAWVREGRALTFISDRSGQADLWWVDVPDGSEMGAGEPARVLDRPGVVRNGRLSPTEGWIVYREGEAPVADVFALPVDAGGAVPRASSRATPVPLADAQEGERSPVLSPDGGWLAYTSIESGEWEVWVTPFSTEAATTERRPRWRVAAEPGQEPVWSRTGGELFYRSWSNELVSVEVQADADGAGTIRFGTPEPLFSMAPFLGSDGRAQYDVASGDDRFLMLRLAGSGPIGLVRLDNLFVQPELARR